MKTSPGPCSAFSASRSAESLASIPLVSAPNEVSITLFEAMNDAALPGEVQSVILDEGIF